METYTVITHGKNIKNCINIPLEYVNKELEIVIRPVSAGGSNLRKKIELILEKDKDIQSFKSISDPALWPREQRRDW